MKRRLTPILTIVAVILIGSIAYAADKRKHAKQPDQATEPIHEEEALRSEILAALEDHDRGLTPPAAIGKSGGNSSQAKKERAKSTK